MKIGLGATAWMRGYQSCQLDGIGYYTQELYTRIHQRTENCFPITFGNYTANHLNIIKLKPYKKELLGSMIRGVFQGECSLQEQAIAIFHSTDHMTPKFKHIPVISTIMDAIPLSHPQWVNSNLRYLKNYWWKKSSGWSDHVITISNYSKEKIVHYFGIKESKITVIPLGVDDRYFDHLSMEDSKKTLKKYHLPETFFLFIGTLQPRKNVQRILDAHQALPDSIQKTHPLVIVGRMAHGRDALIRRLESYSTHHGNIRWLQGVDDLEKRSLLQKATALVFPSLIEGFGLPVLEAFASKTPVITSTTTSLPEVAGQAALLIDPLKVTDLADAMMTLVEDSNKVVELIEKGYHRAKQFTWDACANQTMAVYNKVLH